MVLVTAVLFYFRCALYKSVYHYWHCQGLRICPSVCLSFPSGRLKPAAGLLLWARRPGNIDRLLHDWRAGDQQQPHHSTARSSKCEEYQVNVT